MILIDHGVDTIIIIITRQKKTSVCLFPRIYSRTFTLSTDLRRHMWLVLCTHCKLQVDQDEVAVMC